MVQLRGLYPNPVQDGSLKMKESSIYRKKVVVYSEPLENTTTMTTLVR